MAEFLTAIVAFPTVVFTTLLGFVIVYWCFVLIGAVDAKDFGGKDIDLGGKDIDLGGKDIDLGGKDIDLGGKDIDLGGKDLQLDGGDLDADADADGDGESEGQGGFVGLLQTLGLTGVPITVTFSLLFLYAWIVSIALAGPVLGAVSPGTIALLVGIAVGFFAFGLAIPMAAFSIRPLRPLFTIAPALSNRALVGRIVTVQTTRVDAGFGQAEVDGGDGLGLLVEVRCAKDNKLSRGVKAVIFDYDADGEHFLVVPHE